MLHSAIRHQSYPNIVKECERNCRFAGMFKCYYYDRLAGSVAGSIRPTKRFRRFVLSRLVLPIIIFGGRVDRTCVHSTALYASAKKAAATFPWNEHSKQTVIDDDICFCFYYKFSWAFNFTLFRVCFSERTQQNIEARVATTIPISIRVVVCVYCFCNPSAIKHA